MLRIVSGDLAEQAAPFDPFLLVSEADHRIANSLALVCGLIRTKASAFRGRDSVPAEEAAATLGEIAGQVETVARLSRLLSRRPGDDLVNICDHLRDVCAMLSETLAANRGISITSAFDAEFLIAQEKVLPLSLIVNEVVTNAIKYSHPTGVNGHVEIAFTRLPKGGALLTITDDGVGFPDDFDPAVDGGLGFRVIRALSGQLDGAHTFENGALGITFRLEIPL